MSFTESKVRTSKISSLIQEVEAKSKSRSSEILAGSSASATAAAAAAATANSRRTRNNSSTENVNPVSTSSVARQSPLGRELLRAGSAEPKSQPQAGGGGGEQHTNGAPRLPPKPGKAHGKWTFVS